MRHVCGHQGVSRPGQPPSVADQTWKSPTASRGGALPWWEQSSRPVDEDRLGGFRLMVVVGSFYELAGDEPDSGPDEGDQVRAVDRAPAVLGGLDELERHCETG